MNLVSSAVARLLAALLVVGAVPFAQAYSVLSHEEVVDMAWTVRIVPLLNQRYPGLTQAQLREAHAYAYGGCVIQDIGYYPFGDKQFSDLLHYTRTGDFVAALLRDATTPDEFAFALGALAHYFGDTLGHPVVNVVTGEEYPALRSRFGRIVTYGDNQTAHLRTEFGFDVVEVAHGQYNQDNYRDFIGFQVAENLLGKAFEETYGLPIDAVLKHQDLAVATYRYSVSTLIPKMTKVALASYRGQIEGATPGFEKAKFIYRMRRSEFERQYGKQYARPNFWTRLFAALLSIIPKVGPFRALGLHLPNSDEQAQYLTSINHAEDAYRAAIASITDGSAAALPELDFDTGNPTTEGEYALCDKTYAELVEQLAGDAKAQVTPALLADINSFYANPSAQDASKAKPRDWARVQAALGKLRQKQPLPAPTATADLLRQPAAPAMR